MGGWVGGWVEWVEEDEVGGMSLLLLLDERVGWVGWCLSNPYLANRWVGG